VSADAPAAWVSSCSISSRPTLAGRAFAERECGLRLEPPAYDISTLPCPTEQHPSARVHVGHRAHGRLSASRSARAEAAATLLVESPSITSASRCCTCRRLPDPHACPAEAAPEAVLLLVRASAAAPPAVYRIARGQAAAPARRLAGGLAAAGAGGAPREQLLGRFASRAARCCSARRVSWEGGGRTGQALRPAVHCRSSPRPTIRSRARAAPGDRRPVVP
jgi:hypothetical protein